MLPVLARHLARASRVARPQMRAISTPSKLKKEWPPDFSKLSPQEQLRYEKRYKRRIAHIAQRPKWNKMIQLAQLFTISFVVVYSVLFMDWNNEKQPFDDVRKAVWGFFGLEYHPKSTARSAEDAPEARKREDTWK